MSFSRAPRYDAVPVSSDQARFARGFKESESERAHRETLERAKKIKDDTIPAVLGSKEVPARYKIQVYFGPRRTTLGPNVVQITFWESGRRLHGGGDDLMYMCRNRRNATQGCRAIFSSDCVRNGVAICPSCQKAVNADLLTRDLVRTSDIPITTRELSNLLAGFWRQLDCNADVYCKFDRTDIRYIAMEKKVGVKKARELRGLSIYPLARILTDTAAGGSLEDKLFAFLTA